MVILHIANIGYTKTNGVDVVVPQHIREQSNYAKTALLNIKDIDGDFDGIELQYKGPQKFPHYLEPPFNNPDLVVFHSVNDLEFIKIYKELIINKIPYIIVPHGEITKRSLRKKWLKKKVAYRLIFNKFIRQARAIQCLSANEMQNIAIRTPSKFISTNGIYDSTNKKENYSQIGMRLVYVGRYEVKIKGLDLLIEALASIKDFCINNNIQLNMYGPDIKGRRAQTERLIAKYNVQDLINLNDPVFGKEKEQVLLESDVFIQTSRTEGMPVGIIEAMNYGLPAILTKGTSLAVDIDSFKYGYYAGSTAESIAKAIITAFNNKEQWKEVGINGINYTNENYNWETISKKCISIYNRLLELADSYE